ncbi:MAG: hypothetical protein L6264_05230 [Weeksellaceae bacterium]|nr:hypothetical protein [Bacteroidota bacterium]MCG2780332.1 hypothetical protein [Weeksellaceae bacterium]
MTHEYRKHLLETINNLYEAEQLLFTSALNLVWEGELSHLKEAYEKGDVMEFNMKLLRSVNDPNVQKIVALMTPLLDAAESIKNLNRIADEELGWEEDNQ